MSDKKLYQLSAKASLSASDLVYVASSDGSADGSASWTALTSVLGGVLAATFQAKSTALSLYAAVSPSANIQTFLGAADYAAMRTQLGLVIGTDVQAYSANLTTFAAITPSANVQTLLGAANFSAFRSSLGVAIGSDVQAFSSVLSTYAGIAPSANVQTLLGAASFSAFRASLGVAIGSDVQAYNARLADIAGITWAQGDVLYFNGSNLVKLAAGTSGQFLKTQGAGANPAWDTPAGGGTIGGGSGSTDNAILRADGTGGGTLQNSLITISDAGALGLPDGVRQTFNPDGTNAGLNVGAQAGDPSSLSNGDIWYNSTTNQLMARVNGASYIITPSQVLIERQTPTGTGTVTFSTGLSGYRDLIVVIVGRGTTSATNVTINFRLNNDSGSNYDVVGINSTGAAISTYLKAGQTELDVGNLSAATAPAGASGGALYRICNANDTNLHKIIMVEGGTKTANATNGLFPRIGTGYYRSTSAISQIDLILAAGNYDTGTAVSLYGIY